MSEAPTTKTVSVSGMVCQSCEGRLGRRLEAEPGIKQAVAKYKTGTLEVTFDPGRVAWERISGIIDEMGYTLEQGDPSASGATWKNIRQMTGLAFVVLALYLFAGRYGLFSFLNVFPEADSGMGIGMIFVVGLLTSTHCIAMCGGITISQALPSQTGKSPAAPLGPTLRYGFGRLVSYTVIGGIIGGLGSAVHFSPTMQGAIQAIAGVFMMIMGLVLTGMFPGLRSLVPRLPRFLSGKAGGKRRMGPFHIGLLNGLMPCGPLQAMQLYALSTGTPQQGALSMFAFALGTLPLTIGLGAVAAYLGKRFMGRAMRIGAVIVFLMGLAMLGNGLTLAGFVTPGGMGGGTVVAAEYADNRQTLVTSLRPDAYQPVRVRAGVPLTWHIHVTSENLNGCNNRILIPEYGVEHKLTLGENIIEFTPTRSGVFPYMCWMGMISSRIIVGDAEDTGATPEYDESVLPQPDEDYEEDVPWL